MATHSSLDYSRWAKAGFALGVALLAVGVAGELFGRAVVGSLPAWENTLFTTLEGVGLVIGFCSPWVFGVALPLLE